MDGNRRKINTDGFYQGRSPHRQAPFRDYSRRIEAPIRSTAKTPPPSMNSRPQQFTNLKYYSPINPYSGQPASPLLSNNKPIGKKKFSFLSRLRKNKWSLKRKVFVAVSALIIIVIGMGGWLDWNLNKVFHCGLTCGAQAVFSDTTLKGESQGRINILLLGDSSDRTDPEANGGDLTDSIMVLSIGTKDHTAFMLSIPRDLWVNVPKEGYAKINSVYEYDSISGLENVVQSDLGIPVDYYALVNYGAFKDLVNAVGGVSVDIQSPDPRGLYDPQPYPGASAFSLSNGWHTLSGQQALNLARARGEGYGSYGFPQGDFDRTEHQRQLLVAIAKKAEGIGVVSNPFKISQLFSALGNNVKTDFNIQDALRLAQISKQVNLTNNVQSEAYSYGGEDSLLEAYTSPDGQDALIPSTGVGDYIQLQQFYDRLTSNSPIAKENATVVVLNGSNVDGLAAKESTILSKEGFNVIAVGDPNNSYSTSMIIDESRGKDIYAKQALEKIFSSNTTTTTSTTSPTEATAAQAYNADFVVVLGRNWDNTGQ